MGHLTEAQRYTIEVMQAQKFRQSEIAKTIGKDKSVVSRELKRNSDQRSGKYKSELANRKYQKRIKSKPKATKMKPELKSYIDKRLKQRWSPEQISKTKTNEVVELVSHERIYQYILEDKKHGGTLYTFRRRQKKYKKRLSTDNRGQISNRTNISERPQIVNQRVRQGDLEVDLIMGANHKGALLTINELKTGYCWIEKLESKDADEVAQAIINKLMPYKESIKTITADNGKEFAYHEKVKEALNIDFYFADPYSPWQRGANENLNGLIRNYYPKKTNFEPLTKTDVEFVEHQLNNRPRKRLGFLTPSNVINFLTQKVAFKT